MSCTTLLIGKKASYDGSTMIARNDDASAGRFTPKKLTVVLPGDQPRHYVSARSFCPGISPGTTYPSSAMSK